VIADNTDVFISLFDPPLALKLAAKRVFHESTVTKAEDQGHSMGLGPPLVTRRVPRGVLKQRE